MQPGSTSLVQPHFHLCRPPAESKDCVLLQDKLHKEPEPEQAERPEARQSQAAAGAAPAELDPLSLVRHVSRSLSCVERDSCQSLVEI